MTREYIQDIISKIISEKYLLNDIKLDDVLTEAGMDSINTIEMVVELERIFKFEFEVDKLSYETLQSISTISNYVFESLGD